MRRILFFLILLIISNSIFVFIYGINLQLKAASFHRDAQVECLMDSALILALHDYEDLSRPQRWEKKVELKGYRFEYKMQDIGPHHLYVKLIMETKRKPVEKEYIIKK